MMKIKMPSIHKLITLLAGFYVGILALLSIVWISIPVLPWWLAMAEIFSAWLFLPLPLILPLALIFRSRYLLISTVVASLCFVALFGSFWFPRPETQQNGKIIRITTFNHHYENQNVDAIAAVALSQEADIIAFQELSPSVSDYLALELRDAYPYQWLLPAENASGLGVISRYPFVGQQIDPEFRGQRVLVQIEHQTITLINVHPNTPFPKVPHGNIFDFVAKARKYDQGARTPQIQALLIRTREIDTPLIVVGDFNTSERERVYEDMAVEMVDTYRATTPGFGFTYPNASLDIALPVIFPLIRIDYVWVKGSIAPLQSAVDCQYSGSDHCLLTSDVVIR
jgi:endonuclease/exonuclease/phosphatase (EEP) superfamily protein YafD